MEFIDLQRQTQPGEGVGQNLEAPVSSDPTLPWAPALSPQMPSLTGDKGRLGRKGDRVHKKDGSLNLLLLEKQVGDGERALDLESGVAEINPD